MMGVALALRNAGALPLQAGPGQRRHSRGIALIAVLWVVSIMSLITVGLVQSVRTEVKVSTIDRQRVEAKALGEAAIALAAQQVRQLLMEQPGAGTFELVVEFGGTSMPVRIQGLRGLININSAPVELLALLLRDIGGLDAGAAQELAVRIVQLRSEPTESGLPRRMEAPEDLLQVAGMSYDLYARVAGFVVANLQAGGLDLAASPAEIQALFGFQPGTAAGLGTSSSGNQLLRITALVPRHDTVFEVVRDMQLADQPDRTGMYWQTFHSQIRVAGH